ncbi:MAG: preprotein translocase subunit SecE [Candidatus Marinimicrobia bacterium]|nr:preprotein translocase subunit SecE [Candidatus Neomarinimicrobiota bacterium]
MNKIINYFKSISVEMKKVSWMTKDQMINSTLIVGFFAVLVSVFLFILDFGLTRFVKILFDIEIG